MLPYKFPLIRWLILFFHSSFVRKKVFYSKNIQYTYYFYESEPYVNVCRGVFRTYSNIYGGASLQKPQKKNIIDVRLGFKYASGLGFTVERVYRMQIVIWYSQSRLQKSFQSFLN